jgi:homoserine O-succinyltransferase
MPDSALAGTERQFRNLLTSAAPNIPIDISCYALATLPRSEQGRLYIEQNGYGSVADLARAKLDGLIVTGTEPRYQSFEMEPYWPEMKDLFRWMDREGPSAVLSCLAAHAAVFQLDGVSRQPLQEKRFGLFKHAKVRAHPLTASLPSTTSVAHSRWNELPAEALAECGYQVLTQSADAGVDLFVRRKRSTWLFFQGHPEYDPGALGREYRRDVRRFLALERDTYPALPANYFGKAESAVLSQFQAYAERNRSPATLHHFPMIRMVEFLPSRWRSPSIDVFAAWMHQIADARPQRRANSHPQSHSGVRNAVGRPARAFGTRTAVLAVKG